MKKINKIDFPTSKGVYWYLFWIGKVQYCNQQRKVDFFFYNKLTPTDTLFEDLDYDCCIVKSVPVSYLADYGIGSIYNSSTHVQRVRRQLIW